MQMWYFLGLVKKVYYALKEIDKILPTISFSNLSVYASSILTVRFKLLSKYFSATSAEIKSSSSFCVSFPSKHSVAPFSKNMKVCSPGFTL